MMDFLAYDLKVALLIAVFYLFYRLLLSQETFHRVNRMVLLLTAVSSFVLPLCVITMHRTVIVEPTDTTADFGRLSIMMAEDVAQTPFWQTAVVAAFFIGMALTLCYTLLSVLRVWLLISRSEQHRQADGTVICVVDGNVSPFSWMHYIVLSRSDYEATDLQQSQSTIATILAHERGHISQHHSLDLLLVDTLTALQWFNPTMWMLRQDLRAIHEYEADAAVLSQGINMRQYQYLLIQKAVGHCGYSVVNGISHSTLKNRINMMLTMKSNRVSLLKLLALLPIVGVTLAMQAETVNDYVYEEPQTPVKTVVKKGQKNGQVKIGDKTIEVKADKSATTAPKPSAPKLKKQATAEKQSPKIVFTGQSDGHEPLIVIDGKVATEEQLKALDQDEIDHINVVKGEKAQAYAKHFNADVSNGILFVNTKESMKNGGSKELVSVSVAAKKPQEAALRKQPMGVVTVETPETDNVLFDVVEQMPSFPGGQGELFKFLSQNMRYPATALKEGKCGRVVCTFVVEKDGSVSHIDVARSVDKELDAEAVRVLSTMPKWQPGKQNGQTVRVKYTIPVTFRLK